MKKQLKTVSSLRPALKNPRKISDEELALLGETMREFGDLSGIVFNVHTKHLVGGHQRVKHLDPMWKIDKHAATDKTGTVALGNIRTPFGRWSYREVDWPEKKELAANVAANKVGGTWDDEKLGLVMKELEGSAWSELTGFQPAEIDELIHDVMPQDANEDEIPESPVEPISKLGDIWQLDKHRVMCGDAKIHLPILLGNMKPDLLLTDPPYGIEIVQYHKVGISSGIGLGATNQANGIVKAKIYPIMTNDTPDFDPTFVLGICSTEIVFGANHFADRLPRGSHWLVWDKKAEVGADHNFFSDAELAWTNVQKKTCRVYRHLWSGLIRAGTRDLELKERVHPTQKPVGLFSAIIADYSKPNHVILDPFLGSGTTLIACEQLGRTCLGMEIAPGYVDIIVNRWEALTGKKAERLPQQVLQVAT